MSHYQDRIFSHLAFLVKSDHQATISCAHCQIIGHFTGLYDTELVFVPEVGTAPTWLPCNIQVRYHFRGFDYEFSGQVTSFDGYGHWHLCLPQAIDSANQRLTHLCQVFGERLFEVELNGPWGRKYFSLVAISPYGLRVLFDHWKTPMLMHSELEGRLFLPGGASFSSLPLEVYGVYPYPAWSERRLAGLRFLGLSPDQRRQIAKALAEWEKLKTRPGD